MNVVRSTSLLSRVSQAMEAIAPLSLAEQNTWDNVGVLLEAPAVPVSQGRVPQNKVMLTIDLTMPVLQEAINMGGVGVIVAYHPFLFRPVRRLTLSDPKPAIALTAACHGISVYSPHSALDNTTGGINDFLASLLPPGTTTELTSIPVPNTMRLCTLDKEVTIGDLLPTLKQKLNLGHIRFATPCHTLHHRVKTVAICAGSGGSTLIKHPADLYLTGELSHHEVLSVLENGAGVVLCEHSGSERAYLQVLKEKLENELKKLSEGSNEQVQVVISQRDREPVQLYSPQ